MKKYLKKICALFMGIYTFLTCFTSCENATVYEDYYTFGLNSVMNEMLVNTSQKIDPVVRNLGDVVENPNYLLEVKSSDGTDVTNTMYEEESKLFTPTIVDEYTISLTALNEEGEVIRNGKGNSFTKSVNINVLNLDIEPVTTMDEVGVSIDHNDLSITFDEMLETPREVDVKQYKLTGVSFTNDFKLSFDVSNLGYDSTQGAPKIFVGFKRDTTDQEDDSFGYDPKNKTFSSWMKNVPASEGWRTIGNGWQESVNRATRSDGTHRVSVTRIIDQAEEKAYWTVEYDDIAIGVIDAGKEYTEKVVTVFFTTYLASGTIRNFSFEQMPEDVKAPVLEKGKVNFGKTVNLKECINVTDDSVHRDFCKINYTIKNAKGETIVPVGSNFTAEKQGDYTVSATAIDLLGNEGKIEDVVVHCGPMANLSSLPVQFVKNIPSPISFLVENDYGNVAKGQVAVKVFKDGKEVNGSVSGTFLQNNVKINLNKTDLYELQVLYKSEVVGRKTITCVNEVTKKPEIDLSAMTANGRTYLGHEVYFKAYDAVDGDITDSATVTFKQKVGVTEVNVTSQVYDVATKTFRPLSAGTYILTVSVQNSGGLKETIQKTIQVSDRESVIYRISEIDSGIEQWNGITQEALSSSTVLHDGFRFDNMGDRTVSPKFNIIPSNIKGNWSISFTGIDLKSARTINANVSPFAAMSFVLILGNTKATASPLIFDTFGLRGKPNNDVWGWRSCISNGLGIDYAWASSGQGFYDLLTDEFNPGENKIPLKWNYLGEHTYRLRCRTNENGHVIYSMYIDDTLFAVHDTSKLFGYGRTDHNNYSDLLGVQFCSQYMEGTIKDIVIVNE